VCASNIRQSIIAVNAYAADFNGLLPVHRARPEEPVVTYEMRNGAFGGFGLLYQGGYSTTGMVFYCPSATAPEFTYDFYVSGAYSGWDFLQRNDKYRSSYYYLPQVVRDRDGSILDEDQGYIHLEDMEPGRTLVMDILHGDAKYNSHTTEGAVGWTAGAADGSTVFHADEAMWDAVLYNSVMDLVQKSWTRFLPCLDRLQGTDDIYTKPPPIF
jgi:hypothetical protein